MNDAREPGLVPADVGMGLAVQAIELEIASDDRAAVSVPGDVG
ncbi:MAG: hypothetical protein ABR961_11365 [Thermoanaerobaculaceae bacterium]